MMTILIFFSTKQNRTDNDPACHCAAAAVIRRRNRAPSKLLYAEQAVVDQPHDKPGRGRKKILVTLFVSQGESLAAMLNVNVAKHPHAINERGMASLETGRVEK